MRVRRVITAHQLADAAGREAAVVGRTKDIAARGLTLAETADVMGQDDPLTTWKHYLRLFDRSKVNERIRAAQESFG